MRRHWRMAFLVAFTRLGERADAEDVCQEVFVRCWARIDECRHPERVSAWIATMVRNASHNRADYLRVRDAAPISAAETIASGDRTEHRAERAELRVRLTDALRRLSQVQGEVVLLHDLEGWTHPEIARRLDISDDMSRRHLSDARKRLRALLSDLSTLGTDDDR
jgi:RNA polymerase sigma-70 factor (ECF subfamily)